MHHKGEHLKSLKGSLAQLPTQMELKVGLADLGKVICPPSFFSGRYFIQISICFVSGCAQATAQVGKSEHH